MDPTINPTIQAINNGVTNAQSSFAPIPLPNLPTTGDLTKYYQQAFQTLQPYYQAKLQQAGGDLNQAIAQITYDYQTGTRYNQEDTAKNTSRQNEDLAASLKTLGLQSLQETQSKEDALNQRGIATVQGSTPGTAKAATGDGSQMTSDAQGNTSYTGQGGQAGSELAMLSEDQQLRKEAEQRTVQRNLQDISQTGQRTQAQLQDTQAKSTYTSGRSYQDTTENLGQQQQSQAYAVAGQQVTADNQQKQLDQQAAQDKAAQQAFKQS